LTLQKHLHNALHYIKPYFDPLGQIRPGSESTATQIQAYPYRFDKKISQIVKEHDLQTY